MSRFPNKTQCPDCGDDSPRMVTDGVYECEECRTFFEEEDVAPAVRQKPRRAYRPPDEDE